MKLNNVYVWCIVNGRETGKKILAFTPFRLATCLFIPFIAHHVVNDYPLLAPLQKTWCCGCGTRTTAWTRGWRAPQRRIPPIRSEPSRPRRYAGSAGGERPGNRKNSVFLISVDAIILGQKYIIIWSKMEIHELLSENRKDGLRFSSHELRAVPDDLT